MKREKLDMFVYPIVPSDESDIMIVGWALPTVDSRERRFMMENAHPTIGILLYVKIHLGSALGSISCY